VTLADSAHREQMEETFERNDARDLAKTEEFFKILAKENPKEFTRLLGFFPESVARVYASVVGKSRKVDHS